MKDVDGTDGPVGEGTCLLMAQWARALVCLLRAQWARALVY